MLEIRCAFLALLLVFAGSAFAAPVPSVSLAASLERSVCSEGQPVVLALTLHNDAAKNLFTASAFEASAFQITVMNEASEPVSRTAVGERVLTPPMAVSANAIAVFAPGQTLLYRFNLARLFDLSRAGVYTVSVSRSLCPHTWPPLPGDELSSEFTLTAGPLKVQMVEDAAATTGPTAYAPPPSRQPFLYIVGRYDDGVSHYLVREDGNLSFSMAYSRLGSPRVSKGADSIAVTPDGRFLYVGSADDNTVSQFRIGDNGVLFPLSPPTVPVHPFPGSLLMDPKGRFLYNLSGTLYAVGSDGRLTVTVSVANDPPGKIEYSDKGNVVASYSGVIDPAGTFLYGCGAITGGYHLALDGTILAPPPPARTVWPDGGNNNAVAISPSGKFAFIGVSTQNASGGFDRVVPMRVEANGTLTPIPGAVRTPPVPPRPSPGPIPFLCTTLAVDPTGHFLVVVNPGYLDCFRIGADGVLTFLSMAQQGDLTSVFFGPVGHLVYALNRNGNTLTTFRLDNQYGLIASGLEVTHDVPFDACMASAVAPTPLKWGPALGGIAVSAHLPGDVLPANAPVVLTVLLKNVTKHPIRLGTAGADMAAFRLSVVGPHRQSPGVLRGGGEPLAGLVPLLAAGHDLLDAPSSSAVPVVLPPGSQRQYQFVLSRLADLTVAGNYTVQITRTLPSRMVVASPVVPFLLDGPFNGLIRDGQYSVQIM